MNHVLRMPELEEIVARGIAPKAWTGADTLPNRNRRAASLKHARAALEAVITRVGAVQLLSLAEHLARSGVVPDCIIWTHHPIDT